MTAKEKALELINDFYPCTDVPRHENAVKCAILALEEIINLDVVWVEEETQKMYPRAYDSDQCKEYWDEVLTELKSMK